MNNILLNINFCPQAIPLNGAKVSETDKKIQQIKIKGPKRNTNSIKTKAIVDPKKRAFEIMNFEFACKSHSRELVKNWIRANQWLLKDKTLSWNPFEEAIKHDCSFAFETMIAAKVNPFRNTFGEKNAYLAAANHGLFDTLIVTIESNKQAFLTKKKRLLEKLLLLGVAHNHEKFIDYLLLTLKLKADKNSSFSILQCAIAKHRAEVAIKLLSKGYRGKAKDVFECMNISNSLTVIFAFTHSLKTVLTKKKETPLHVALIVKNNELIKFFINYDVNQGSVWVNKQDAFGQLPLQIALVLAQDPLIARIRKHTKKLEVVDQCGNSLLHTAIMYNKKDFIEGLVLHSLIFQKNILGISPYEKALMQNDLKLARFFLEFGKSSLKDIPETTINYFMNTGVTQLTGENKHLFYSILKTHSDQEVLEWLEKITVSTQDREATKSFSALHYAAERRGSAVINALLDRGFEIDARDKFNRTPLLMAAVFNNQVATNQLILRGADVNVKNSMGSSLLLMVAKNSDWKSVESILLSQGFDKEKVHDGNIVVKLAIENAKFSILQLLLEKGFQLKDLWTVAVESKLEDASFWKTVYQAVDEKGRQKLRNLSIFSSIKTLKTVVSPFYTDSDTLEEVIFQGDVEQVKALILKNRYQKISENAFDCLVQHFPSETINQVIAQLEDRSDFSVFLMKAIREKQLDVIKALYKQGAVLCEEHLEKLISYNLYDLRSEDCIYNYQVIEMLFQYQKSVLNFELDYMKKMGSAYFKGSVFQAFLENDEPIKKLTRRHFPEEYPFLERWGSRYDVQLMWGIETSSFENTEEKLTCMQQFSGLRKLYHYLEANPENDSLKKMIKNTLDCKAWEDIKNGHDGFVISGWKGHAASLYFTCFQWNQQKVHVFFKCNRGERSKGVNHTVEVYIYKKMMTESVMDQLCKLENQTQEYYEKTLNRDLDAHFLVGLDFKDQKFGNCYWTQAKIAVYCKAFADQLKKEQDLNACHAAAYSTYKQYTAYFRYQALKNCIELSPPNHPPVSLLAEVRDKARNKFDNTLQQDYMDRSIKLIDDVLTF